MVLKADDVSRLWIPTRREFRRTCSCSERHTVGPGCVLLHAIVVTGPSYVQHTFPLVRSSCSNDLGLCIPEFLKKADISITGDHSQLGKPCASEIRVTVQAGRQMMGPAR